MAKNEGTTAAQEEVQAETAATPVSGVIEVSAKKEGFDEVTITYDFGKDLDEMVAKFGGEVAFTNARANMKITLQSIMRRLLAAGKSSEEIAATCAEWKPGVQLERTVDPVSVARKAMSNMNEDEKQAFIQKLLAGEA